MLFRVDLFWAWGRKLVKSRFHQVQPDFSLCCSMESMRAVLSKLLLKTLYSATWSFYIDETVSICKVIIYCQYLGVARFSLDVVSLGNSPNLVELEYYSSYMATRQHSVPTKLVFVFPNTNKISSFWQIAALDAFLLCLDWFELLHASLPDRPIFKTGDHTMQTAKNTTRTE